MNKKPNILFAIADDASHMSAYGHQFVNTPSFDRVANEGLLFTNAFTTNPKCAPSRASILTGMHTWQLEEACSHFSLFPAKFTVFPDILEDSGYFIGYTGKGWSPGDWKSSGRTRNPAGVEFNTKKLIPPKDSFISATDYTANFKDFLESRPTDTPFFFWYGAHEPHRHYNPGEGLRGGKKIEDVSHIPSYLPQDDIVKRDLLDYAYEIEWGDMHLGNMLQLLEEIGELDNTLIVVTSDNGMPFPRVKGQMYEQDFKLPLAIRWGTIENPGRKVDELMSFVDLAPTFLKVADITPLAQMIGKDLLDIFQPSHYSKHPRTEIYMGREFHDLGSEGDKSYPVRCIRTQDYLYVRNFEPDRWPAGNPETGFTNCDSSPTKNLILDLAQQGDTHFFDLAFGKRPLEELYHIKSDEECLHNLALAPEYEELKTTLWTKLKYLLETTQDPRILGKGDIFDTYPYVGNNRHSWKAYEENRWQPQPF